MATKFILAPSLRGNQLFTARDLEMLLGRSVAQLARMRRSGRGPRFERYDGRYYYRPSCVVDWLNEQARLADQEARHDA